MKVKSKVTQEVLDFEIHPPMFRKSLIGSGVRYFAILPDETCISMASWNNFSRIIHSDQENVLDDIYTIFTTWETIEEEEFLSAHAKAVRSLSLKAVLVQDKNDIPKELFTQGESPYTDGFNG